MSESPTPRGPHQGQPVRTAGASLSAAHAAMIMVHGRGATAESILELVPVLDAEGGGFAYLAPQAFGNTWYPNSFLSTTQSNEPGISSGLQALADIVDVVLEADIPHERIILLGFSQGACLSIEFAARNARKYGGVACLSGGLIGPEETPRDYPGDFMGTPVFFGCSDVDSHVPATRVSESAAVLDRMGASVTSRLYPGMGHLVNADEIKAVRAMMTRVASARAV